MLTSKRTVTLTMNAQEGQTADPAEEAHMDAIFGEWLVGEVATRTEFFNARSKRYHITVEVTEHEVDQV